MELACQSLENDEITRLKLIVLRGCRYYRHERGFDSNMIILRVGQQIGKSVEKCDQLVRDFWLPGVKTQVNLLIAE